jgi:diaminopimelate decarboxylase
MIEPGRSIVCNAGTTLYTVESRKTTYSGKSYVLVDGGMTDNPRPALYQAEYEGAIANRLNDQATQEVCVAGKCCESGDVLIQKTMLQAAQVGDILAIASTGAYTYSMSSNYNSVRRAAVVMVKDGVDRLVTRRYSFDYLLKNVLELED